MRKTAALLLLVLSAPVFAGVTEWLPIEVADNGHIFVPVTLNGQAGRALLDTGASGNAISLEFIEQHGLEHSNGSPIIMSGIHDDIYTNFVNDIELGMFGSEFEVDELMPFESGYMDFIIGLPFFYQFVVQIDYPGERMRLITRDTVNMKEFANVKMTIRQNSTLPMVRVELNGEYKPWLIFDTGSTGGVYIQRLRAEKYGWLETFEVESSSSTGISGEASSTEAFRLPSFTIGPFTLENVRVVVPAEGGDINMQKFRPDDWSTGSKIKKGKPADGILGYDVLKHFIVTIDLKGKFLNLDVPR